MSRSTVKPCLRFQSGLTYYTMTMSRSTVKPRLEIVVCKHQLQLIQTLQVFTLVNITDIGDPTSNR
jgi:hypothetical protein